MLLRFSGDFKQSEIVTTSGARLVARKRAQSVTQYKNLRAGAIIFQMAHLRCTSSLALTSKSLRPPITCRCAQVAHNRIPLRPSPVSFSTSTTSSSPYDEQRQPQYSQDRPRWQQTPSRMTAPFRSKPPTKVPNEFEVNEDPQLLDDVLVRVLGKDGDKMLTDEVKWLAITHKSFDHGRRGYNDRLAFIGTRVPCCINTL